MVISSFGEVVLPCVLFYRSPLKFSRSAHRLATGRTFSAHRLFSAVRGSVSRQCPRDPEADRPQLVVGGPTDPAAAARERRWGVVRPAPEHQGDPLGDGVELLVVQRRAAAEVRSEWLAIVQAPLPEVAEHVE